LIALDRDRIVAKQRLRSAFTERRNCVPAREADLAGRALAAALLEERRVREARRVALYAASGGELPTRVTFEVLASTRAARLFPRIQGAEIVWARIDSWDELSSGQFGVPEPGGAPISDGLDRRDVVLVPGLAFDRAGWRLGRGGGHYDRAFSVSTDAPWLIGVGYAFQWIAEVPHDSRDRRVDAIVTEHGWVWRARG
jgi:5-formyltetrahydrofolate cyclo-ligase